MFRKPPASEGLSLLLLASLLLPLAGCTSREEKICKKMALLMGSSAAAKTKIERCIKRARRAKKAIPKRFECRARCIESSVDRKSFNVCNDKCDPAAAARRAAIKALQAARRARKVGAKTPGKTSMLAVPRDVRRKWFVECAAQCRHHIKESGSQKERIEGTKRAGLCSSDCIKKKIAAYRAARDKK